MAQLPDVFKPDEAEDASFSTIPAGWYTAEITKSELKDTREGGGKYIALTFKIIESEEYDGRFVFTNLNIVNKNPTAVKIARSDLKKICSACGIDDELEDTEDLHNIPLQIKLKIKPETAQWPEKNEIADYRHEGEQ